MDCPAVRDLCSDGKLLEWESELEDQTLEQWRGTSREVMHKLKKRRENRMVDQETANPRVPSPSPVSSSAAPTSSSTPSSGASTPSSTSSTSKPVPDTSATSSGVSSLSPGAISRMRSDFERNFRDGESWILKSGTDFDAILHRYTMTLKVETALHSFIWDQRNNRLLELFPKTDREEVESCFFAKPKKPELPRWKKQILLEYSLDDASLRNRLRKGWTWKEEEEGPEKEGEEGIGSFTLEPQETQCKNDQRSQTEEEDFRMAVHCAILEIWRVYQARSAEIHEKQSEAWFALRIWNGLVDGLLGDMKGIKLVRGEKCSTSSSYRKNDGRDLDTRKAMGRKIDGIFASRLSKVEYGAIEVGKDDEGYSGSKALVDARKLAKLSKDMLDHLLKSCTRPGQVTMDIEVLGLLQSGLHIEFLSLVKTRGRYCIFRRESSFTIPKSLKNKGINTILLLIKELLVLGERLRQVESAYEAAKHVRDEVFFHQLFDVSESSEPDDEFVSTPKTLNTPKSSPKTRAINK
ncbi:hypothetical protein BGZ58_002500 [Dissophora ornata]|nr:hypothetical protein BGZ58_002500 [Dissophora ornata]